MRTFTIILTALALCLSLPACSKKDDDTKKSEDGHTDHSHK